MRHGGDKTGKINLADGVRVPVRSSSSEKGVVQQYTTRSHAAFMVADTILYNEEFDPGSG